MAVRPFFGGFFRTAVVRAGAVRTSGHRCQRFEAYRLLFNWKPRRSSTAKAEVSRFGDRACPFTAQWAAGGRQRHRWLSGRLSDWSPWARGLLSLPVRRGRARISSWARGQLVPVPQERTAVGGAKVFGAQRTAHRRCGRWEHHVHCDRA